MISQSRTSGGFLKGRGDAKGMKAETEIKSKNGLGEILTAHQPSSGIKT